MPVPLGLIEDLKPVSNVSRGQVLQQDRLTLYTQSIIEAASWDSVSLSEAVSLSNERDSRRRAYVL